MPGNAHVPCPAQEGLSCHPGLALSLLLRAAPDILSLAASHCRPRCCSLVAPAASQGPVSPASPCACEPDPELCFKLLLPLRTTRLCAADPRRAVALPSANAGPANLPLTLEGPAPHRSSRDMTELSTRAPGLPSPDHSTAAAGLGNQFCPRLLPPACPAPSAPAPCTATLPAQPRAGALVVPASHQEGYRRTSAAKSRPLVSQLQFHTERRHLAETDHSPADLPPEPLRGPGQVLPRRWGAGLAHTPVRGTSMCSMPALARGPAGLAEQKHACSAAPRQLLIQTACASQRCFSSCIIQRVVAWSSHSRALDTASCALGSCEHSLASCCSCGEEPSGAQG